jgi:hypothetical protein
VRNNATHQSNIKWDNSSGAQTYYFNSSETRAKQFVGTPLQTAAKRQIYKDLYIFGTKVIGAMTAVDIYFINEQKNFDG